MNIDLLLSFSLAVALLSVSPGPDNIYVLTISATDGWKYGLATVAGLMSGCMIHTTFVAFGVSILIAKSNWAISGLKTFGALYVFYLAFRVYISPTQSFQRKEMAHEKRFWKYFLRGFIMNVLNPKVSLFFLALFPSFLFSNVLSELFQFYVLGFLFVFIAFSVFSTIALFSDAISSYLKGNKNSSAFLKWFQVFVYIGIGTSILAL